MVAPMPLEIGSKYKSKKSGDFIVTESLGNGHYKVTFEDGYETTAIRHWIINGSVKNPNYPSALGVGFVGEGEYVTYKSPGRASKIYTIWYQMLQRCYNPEIQELFPTYKGVLVDKHWHNFQNFADWFTNYKYGLPNWQLDKDLLQIGIENKVYGPETCCMVPRIINLNLIKSSLELGKFDKQVTISRKKDRYYVRNIPDAFICVEDAVDRLISNKKQYMRELAERYRANLDPRAVEVLEDFQINVNITELKKYLG